METDYRTAVRFARPDAESILAGGFFPADLHFHTDQTDGTVSIPSLLARIRKSGIGCAVTDHNEISGALAAWQERGPLLVIPGIEVSASDGPHILVYFYSPRDLEDFFGRHIRSNRRENPWMQTTLSSETILEAAEEYSCLRGAAHPYGFFMFNAGLAKCIEKGYLDPSLYGRCDVIEGICSNMLHSENLRAVELASKLGLPVSGGSDGHVLFDHGTAVTCTTSEDPAGFLDELRKGRMRVIGREQHALSKLATALAINIRFFPRIVPSMKIHGENVLHRLEQARTRRRQP